LQVKNILKKVVGNLKGLLEFWLVGRILGFLAKGGSPGVKLERFDGQTKVFYTS
jgi:hypothetical protein